MRRRTLLLMEQLLMTLVFALAAALCLRAFALADSLSHRAETRDFVLRQAQNMTELCRADRGDLAAAAAAYGGSWNGSVWRCGWDADGNLVEGDAACWVEVTLLPEEGLLGRAQVRAGSAKDGLLSEFPAAWQREETP